MNKKIALPPGRQPSAAGIYTVLNDDGHHMYGCVFPSLDPPVGSPPVLKFFEFISELVHPLNAYGDWQWYAIDGLSLEAG